MGERQVTLAAVAGAHGVGGEVRLKLFAESLDGLKRHKRLFADGRPLEILSLRPAGAGAIARLEGIGDRNAAEALRGTLLTVPRCELPPLEPGEYYHADLIGLACRDEAGDMLGTVVAVENFGAGDLLEIERPGGKRAMVPFRDGIADLRDGVVIVDPLFLA